MNKRVFSIFCRRINGDNNLKLLTHVTCYKHLRLSMVLMMLRVKHGLTQSGQENID